MGASYGPVGAQGGQLAPCCFRWARWALLVYCYLLGSLGPVGLLLPFGPLGLLVPLALWACWSLWPLWALWALWPLGPLGPLGPLTPLGPLGLLVPWPLGPVGPFGPFGSLVLGPLGPGHWAMGPHRVLHKSAKVLGDSFRQGLQKTFYNASCDLGAALKHKQSPNAFKHKRNVQGSKKSGL